MDQPACANCGATLTGPYCAACGQHAHESARGIGVLFHDAWHLLTHVDGRFWRTLYTLLLQPGLLTREYMAERRARYLPPVRLYLVLSVLFFALGSLGPRPSHDGTAPGQYFFAQDCQTIKSSSARLEPLLRQACERNVLLGGQPVRSAFADYIPKMMFVFLPMMALIMLLLYWRPRRYYVEHLVFFLHIHAAMFLILLFDQLLLWGLSRLPAARITGGLLTVCVCAYALWYIYRAMRVYYLQRRWPTVAKLIVVGFAYTTFLTTTLLATLFFSALFA
jgi:Protein of unknown function (DUF3667)